MLAPSSVWCQCTFHAILRVLLEIGAVGRTGFSDPFHPTETITLDNPQYRFFGISLMKGKLDWLLLRRLQVVSTNIGNADYSASDHKWLSADVTFA